MQPSAFAGSAATLTPYAVRFRYPGGPLEPDVAEARQSLALAADLVRFVKQLLGI